MALANCMKCGKLCFINHRKLCYDCLQQEQKEIDIITNLLDENPSKKFTVNEITGINTSVILRMMREGKVSPNNDNCAYSCANCGTIITKGKLCSDCREELEEDFRDFKDRQKVISTNSRILKLHSNYYD